MDKMRKSYGWINLELIKKGLESLDKDGGY